MSGKKKLYFLLKHIVDARDITPSGQPLIIDPTNDLNRKYRDIELLQLFTKLEKDEKVLRVLKAPSRTKQIDVIERLDPYGYSDDGCWHIELLAAFNDYYFEIQNEPEYQKFTGKKPLIKAQNHVIRKDIYRKEIFGGRTFSAKALEIADSFSSGNYDFVLMVLKEILSSAELSADGKVDYQLQSPSGHPNLIKERALLRKFEVQGLFRNLGEDGIFGIASLTNLDTKLIKEIVLRIDEWKSGVISVQNTVETEESDSNDIRPLKQATEIKKTKKLNQPNWQNDFIWEGKRFVFGKYGSTSIFNSKIRLTMFRELTKAKGNWVTVNQLKKLTSKDETYLRPTIGQIEKTFNSNLKKYISIPSTEEDDLQPKPPKGAYRIRFTPKSL